MENQGQPTSTPSVTPTQDVSPSAPATPVVDQTPVTPPVSTPAAPVTPTQEATPAQDSFTNFDPSQLTDPNAIAAYKQMQADYTKKMQEISSERTKYSELAPVLEAMQQHKQGQDPVSPVINSMEKQLKEAGYDENTIAAGKMIAGTILNHMNQTKQSEQQTSFVSQQFAEAVKMDSRLEDSSLVYDYGEGKATFGDIVEELVAADPKWKDAPLASVQRAIKKVDAMINVSKTQGKQELSQKTTVKAQAFAPVNTSPQGAADQNRSMSLRESIEAAQRQTGG